jgi:hypothetical protein
MTIARASFVARMRTAARRRISRRDWIGDAVVMLVAASAGVVGVFLPWANKPDGGDVNFSLTQAAGIRAAIQTPWGLQALLAAAAVVMVGTAMLWIGPRRVTASLGLVSVVGGAVFVISSLGATDAMAPLFKPGVGLYVTLLSGILLVPIGVASAMVGGILVRSERAAGTTGG